MAIMRKIAAIPIILALAMITLVTVVPHHHHQTMVCFVREICCLDGCCDDEHTQHNDANQPEDERHCIAHEHYLISENIIEELQITSLDCQALIAVILDDIFIKEETSRTGSHLDLSPLPSAPPLISSISPNAPPFLA
jgi:hypothetical protein